MIVDLNLEGKSVVIFGAGHEAGRKVESLLSQKCHIVVIAETAHENIRRRAHEGKIDLVYKRIYDPPELDNLKNLVLVIAATDDFMLNRRLAKISREKRLYTYCVDDPSNSDFSHPAVINLQDIAVLSISTGGKSPLMAKRLREKLEPIIHASISTSEINQIKLQEKIRPKAKLKFQMLDHRRKFLLQVADDLEIKHLLELGQFEKAEKIAEDLLDSFVLDN